MIPPDRLLVTRRHRPATSSLPTIGSRLLLLLLLWRRRRRRLSLSLSRFHTLVHAAVALLLASLASSDTAVALLPTATTLLLRESDIIVCYSSS